MTAKLRHVAFYTDNPRATADFYKNAFGLEELGHGESPGAESVRLSDGDVNLTILKFKDMKMADRLDGRGSDSMGLHHIGFWVDDIEETRKRLAEVGGEYRADLAPADPRAGPGVEEKYRGPQNVMVDISAHGWAGAKPPTA